MPLSNVDCFLQQARVEFLELGFQIGDGLVVLLALGDLVLGGLDQPTDAKFYRALQKSLECSPESVSAGCWCFILDHYKVKLSG